MADLLAPGVEEAIVRAVKARAGAHGRSAEAEHRTILTAALARPRKLNLAELLLTMPEAGRDEDFARAESPQTERDVFD